MNFSRESYNAVANWLSDARSLASPNIVIILCGNKKDLDEQRQVTFDEANRFAEGNGKTNGFVRIERKCFLCQDLMFLETSAKTNENITESFLNCAQKILSKIESGNIMNCRLRRNLFVFSCSGSIDPYRMYSGIQFNRSQAANRYNQNATDSSANESLQKSTNNYASC